MNNIIVYKEYRTVIQDLPPVSPLGLGMWRYRGSNIDDAHYLAESALESGITLFDTADVYGPDNGEPFGAAEALFGRVLKVAPTLRDQIVLATKGGIVPGIPYASRADHLIRAAEASLTRLGTDVIDLYQVHRPDLLAHPAEVAAALDKLRQDGKIRAAGVSNHTPAQVAALQAHLPFKLVSIQPEFSPRAVGALFDGVLDQAMERGLTVLAWSPLAGGRLLAASDDARALAVITELDRIAAANNVGRAAVAYAWILAHPSRPIPLIGSQTPARIREATDAFKVQFTDADWYAVLQAALGAPLP
ncbi:MAG: aldo/keto reductase [Niveispirillum sp.]|uniref:aldo/keto reductase n=1 Tax=Niveispirillum sp. TaxID=1917217 RepID=UPI003BA711CB